VAAFAAPMIGTALADSTTIVLAFYLIAAFRIVASMSFWHLLVRPGKRAT